jgi:BlaI family transcriptional regulator, penicillinase repressor
VPDAIPTERELQALKVLWQLEQATVREICNALNEQGADLAYTTVLSLLQVMEQKRLVGHKASGKVYTYFAKAEREATLARLARGFLDRVFDGAMHEYVLHALDAKKLSAAELARLEELIARARERAPQQTRRKGKEGPK